ncbi:MAG: type II toxin-antitoxin system RelE/ParE family toxin [Alphaproteobacteria bacterium]|nr:type II toxin-antitoxin system RelE/ParE family toxin [Alphaproteobacteria bacterium]
MTVSWLPDALDDLRRLQDFLHPHSPTAALRVVTALVEAAEALVEFPEKGRPWEPDMNYRELLIKHGAKGYVLRYRLLGGNAYIVRAWHAAEDR